MDIRQLRQFIAVAEELSFRKAAIRLSMAQPPLTAAIQRVEEEVGAVLIERSNRVSGLTDAGCIFLAEARRTIEQMDRTIALTQASILGRKINFRLGFIDSVANAVLPKLLQDCRALRPDVDFHLMESTTAEQIRWLVEGQIDVGLLVLPLAHDPGLTVVPLANDPMVLAVPSGHRLAHRRRVKLAEFANDTWCIFPAHQGPGLYDEIIKACASAGFTPRLGQSARQMQTTCGLVAGGMGVALVPRLFTQVKPHGVTFLEIVGTPLEYRYALAFREKSPFGDEFAQVALTAFAQR